jgi:predicted nucleic acid binding AN1-type Zn finger protein
MKCQICHKQASVAIGRCSACLHHFCVFHRLPEKHHCPKLAIIQQKAKDDLRVNFGVR